MHSLQELFATSEGERGFDDRLHALFEAGDFGAAEALLAAELATMDGEIAELCRELPREAAVLVGWDHLVEAIELQEGDPISGITLAFGNDPDLVLDKGRVHEPLITIALYTDEVYAFSGARPADLVAEAKAAEGPTWNGCEEDVELYLEAGGFGPLNTALLLHPERHIFRGTDRAPAPMPYVEYVVGCWWRALRFQQAVAAEHARLDALGGIPVVAGTVEMRPEIASVHLSRARAASTRRSGGTDTTAEIRPELASLRIAGRSASPAPRRTGALDMTVELRPLLAGLDLSGTPESPAAPRIQALDLTAKVNSVPANTNTPETAEPPAELSAEEALELTAEIGPVPLDEDQPEASGAPAPLVTDPLDLTIELVSAGTDTPDTAEVPAERAAHPFHRMTQVEPVADAPDLTTGAEPVYASLDAPEAPEAPAEPAALELTIEVEETPVTSLDTPATPVAETPETIAEIEPEPADSDTPDPVEGATAPAIEDAEIARLAPVDVVPRRPREEKDPTGAGLRRRLAEAEPDPREKRGFLWRLFGRARSYDEAA